MLERPRDARCSEVDWFTSILATKLHVPSPRSELVRRRRLTEQLNEGQHRTLTLISAPAGFGKTTLLSEWAEGTGHRVAWLSLDERENDPARFLAYLVAALQTVGVNLGAEVLGVLHAPQPPTESVLTALLNEVAELPDHVILVLDDYHVIDSGAVDLAVTFLLEHLPPQLHLVIATREDPPFPLSRFRARGELTELRAADLRFTPAEAAEFLGEIMGLTLSAADIAALEDRTENWIAGLQLAALSMRGRNDLPGFIRAFAGTNRYIGDYLVEEVLRRQPEPVRHFLLQTSILERFSGPLCEAVTGQDGGAARLLALERGNFFVVPLDDQRHWYRYHHLFADVLQVQLKAEQPEQVPELHRRASQWHEKDGSAPEAIRHALAARDVERAADLVELAVPAMRRERQEATALGWLQALPAQVIRHRPVLSVYYAGTLVMGGQLDAAETHLLDAERWLNPAPDQLPGASTAGMVVVDEEEFRSLPSSIALYRAAIALVSDNVAGTLVHARRALELSAEHDQLRRGSAAGLLGLAFWTAGNLGAAHQSYGDAVASLHRAGHHSDAVGCLLGLAEIKLAQGDLHAAMRTFQRGLRLAEEPGAARLRGAADMHVGLSHVHRERNELSAATQHLSISRDLGEFAGLPQNRFRWCVASARIREAEGDLDSALGLLEEAQRLYISDLFPDVRPIAALKARVWVRQGQVRDALAWVREQHLSVHDDLSYLREFEHLTLARALLAQSQRDQADHPVTEVMGLLERLQEAAEMGERKGSVIEVLALRALALQRQGDLPAALALLGRALTLAEPGGYVRVFADEGAPMAALLRKLVQQGTALQAVRPILRAIDDSGSVRPNDKGRPESLSERELEVLRLLRSELNGPDMARTLDVSLNTLRTHTQSIYSKLGVKNRRAAIRCAEELGVF